MDRHPTERDVLVEKMSCGCRLEWRLCAEGRAEDGALTLSTGMSIGLGFVNMPKTIARLYECAEHSQKAWEEQ